MQLFFHKFLSKIVAVSYTRRSLIHRKIGWLSLEEKTGSGLCVVKELLQTGAYGCGGNVVANASFALFTGQNNF